MKISLLIAAGGSSNRMGFNKILEKLFDRPVIVHTLKAFKGLKDIQQIVVAVPSQQIDYYAKEIILKYCFDQNISIIEGGRTRIESVINAYSVIKKDSDLIAIHDAARPFVSQQTIKAVCQAAYEKGAAIVTTAVIPTVKRVTPDGKIIATIARKKLSLAATPQVFSKEVFADAIKKYLESDSNELITDDAQIVENAGHQVWSVKGNLENIKLTTPFDWEVAQACGQKWLKSGK